MKQNHLAGDSVQCWAPMNMVMNFLVLRTVGSTQLATRALAVPQFRRLAAGFLPRRTRFALQSVQVGFVLEKVALETGYILQYFSFVLSVSLHRCSICTHVSSGERTMGSLAAAVSHRRLTPSQQQQQQQQRLEETKKMV